MSDLVSDIVVIALILFAIVASAILFYPPHHTVAQLEAAHPSWSEWTIQHVSQNQVWIGMTAEQARESWGDPFKVNRSVYATGAHEQWVYYPGGDSTYAKYLYFDDGILTGIQQ
jgi:hypothetical protein